MIGLDTNILVRYLAQDDARQSPQATRLLESMSSDAPGFVSNVALIETTWVLEDIYAMPKTEVVGLVESLLQTDALVLQSANVVWQALRSFASSRAEFTDHLIERIGAAEGCSATVTFDKIAARDTGMRLMPRGAV